MLKYIEAIVNNLIANENSKIYLSEFVSNYVCNDILFRYYQWIVLDLIKIWRMNIKDIWTIGVYNISRKLLMQLPSFEFHYKVIAKSYKKSYRSETRTFPRLPMHSCSFETLDAFPEIPDVAAMDLFLVFYLFLWQFILNFWST